MGPRVIIQATVHQLIMMYISCSVTGGACQGYYSTIMCNPSVHYSGKGVTHDCAIVSLAKGITLFPRFFSWCIPMILILHLCIHI